MHKMKIFFALVISLFVFQTNAQIKKVTIQASGLTCSLCSNAINKSLLSLPSVAKVIPNIKNSSFEIFFNEGSIINYDDLKKKVEDAGFFVAQFNVSIEVHSLVVANDAHLELDGLMYHFLGTGNRTLNGEVELQLLDKGFVPAKVFKKNAKLTQFACYQTGQMGKCCKGAIASPSTRIFHVTI